MKRKKKRLTRVFGLVSIVGALLAANGVLADGIERAVDYRQGVMNVFSWNMKAMGDMMKGKVAFDQEAFANHASDLATAARLDLMPGFPEDSESDESAALPEIWMEFDDFEGKYRDLRKRSKGLSEIAASGDKAKLGEALDKTGKACKACHKKFKN
ncbi:MAG: cytochrome c [Candidatus Thiodiazotropha sp. (ex Dulcina madagascariensis)]|nr:cytochrome c [Candidatus Thiodiazotropha sp. (ex Dulcina madagascariensis)]MCU7928359.1 cytochrome c [Candidatus Thiodiazotropha sp. (ex Dulcina madagascariensis)]